MNENLLVQRKKKPVGTILLLILILIILGALIFVFKKYSNTKDLLETCGGKNNIQPEKTTTMDINDKKPNGESVTISYEYCFKDKTNCIKNIKINNNLIKNEEKILFNDAMYIKENSKLYILDDDFIIFNYDKNGNDWNGLIVVDYEGNILFEDGTPISNSHYSGESSSFQWLYLSYYKFDKETNSLTLNYNILAGDSSGSTIDWDLMKGSDNSAEPAPCSFINKHKNDISSITYKVSTSGDNKFTNMEETGTEKFSDTYSFYLDVCNK